MAGMRTTIVYEDNHVLVAVKPRNMPVQADSSGDMDLLTLLKAYLKRKYQKPGNVYLGLVMREVDRGDQRAMRVCLSPKGREICVQGRRCMHEMVQSMLEDFRPEEIRRFAGYLGRVEANLLRQETGHEADREQPASDG